MPSPLDLGGVNIQRNQIRLGARLELVQWHRIETKIGCYLLFLQPIWRSQKKEEH